jgi:hypothetical protein
MKDNIFIIEYDLSVGSHIMERVAMYNENVITEEEVVKLINNGNVDDDDRVVVMNRKQYDNLVK